MCGTALGAPLSPPSRSPPRLQEVEFLSSSIAQLKVVQTKYVEAKDCLNVLNKSNEGKWGVPPPEMYVPGKLSDVERVLIDIGTGYYVEKVKGQGGDAVGFGPSMKGREKVMEKRVRGKGKREMGGKRGNFSLPSFPPCLLLPPLLPPRCLP
uniref:Prefoldin subunit 5 n=1 Tax=Amazona collaria TaxID=241587 RepID=A0A8B9G2I9_9PSIT